MELVERVQNFRRNFNLAEDPNLPWYRQKKNIMFLIIGILVVFGVAVLFFGGYSAGLAASKEPDVPEADNNVPEAEPRVVLPPLEWDGVCPKGIQKCPSSFQGTLPLILVSLDGFHPDFMERGYTPTIKNIAKCGTQAPYMFPVFPTKTFPNHYSQVTGLFPPHHGIIDNTMYDPFKKKLFKVGQPESLESSWWLKEPISIAQHDSLNEFIFCKAQNQKINFNKVVYFYVEQYQIWVTAQKQGKKSGCFYWPGSEVDINGTLPTYYKKYNSKVSFESRVDQVLAWLDLPTTSRPHLFTLYVNQPDNALHNFGINSKQTDDALAKVDRMIERLFSGLQKRNLVNCVNVIIISDHGMSDTDCKRVIDIQNYINVNDTFITAGPFGRIRPKGKRNATVVDQIVSKLRCKSPHMRAYPKEQLPVRMHYADNPRIEPIFLDIDAGWTVVSKSVKSDGSICSGGAHGYDNMFRDMRAIFLAHGPAFKKNFTMQPFINTEIYEMLAELIGISPNPNNGTRGSMHYIMTTPKSLSPQTEPESPTIADVPSEDSIYNDRLSASTCSCTESPKQLQVQNLVATKNLHLPFGIPYSSEDHSSLHLLYNDDYINAFSLKYTIPLWSAFTLKEQKEYTMVEEICWKGDARISPESSPKCGDYAKTIENYQNILQRPLYPPGFSDSSITEQATFITNSIAKSFNHSKIIERPFNEMLRRWVSQTGELNVVIGPSFDVFASGVRPNTKEFMKLIEKNSPVLIPTHIFAITTWCSVKADSLKSCDSSKLQSQAYLLPNEPYPTNCEAAADVISKNVARVVDVEKLTGISFYTGLPIYDAIRLRTMMPERSF